MRHALIPLLLIAFAGPPTSPPPRLVYEIDRALAAAPAGSAVGVAVISGRTGATIYARDGARPLVPASNAKVALLAAALEILGPEHVFRTEALAAGPMEGGTLRGALALRGSGDPSLTSEGLWGLALDLEAAGLRRVEGDLILDDGAFDRSAPPAAGPARNEGRPYGAVTSALTANFNTVAIEVAPGARPGDPIRAALVPPIDGIRIVNRARTAGAGKLVVDGPRVEGRGAVVTLRGTLPAGSAPRRIWRSVDSPALFAGLLFKATLARADIAITGDLRVGRTPEGARVIAARDSPPLAVLARDVGKRSNNLYAEQILRALDPHVPRTTRGGLARVEAWLSAQGVDPGTYKLVDGSGLSRDNRLAPLALVRIWRAACRRPESGAEFLSAFGIAGTDGTLERRLGGLRGRVRGKTGYLDGVSALSGRMLGAGGEEVFFAVLVNASELTGPAAARTLEDRIVRAIAAHGP
jgi:D-alanyl-D-alanine carboxypeptidase/D-alanyl-D-alanine-endopeptidase (penicillin-binding protein 4)